MDRAGWLLLALGVGMVAASACSDDAASPVAAGDAGMSGAGETSTAGSSQGGSSGGGAGTSAGAGMNASASGEAGAPPNPNVGGAGGGGSPGAGGVGGVGETGAGGGAGGGGAGGGGAGGAGEPVLDPECQYLEAADLDNGGFPQEVSGLTFGAGASDTVVICGQIDVGHYDQGTVDEDGFSYQVAAAGQYVVTLELENADNSGYVRLDAGNANDLGPGAYGFAQADVKAAAWSEHYSNGRAVVSVYAYSDTNDLDKPLKYKIRIHHDNWLSSCVVANAQAAAQSYSESGDGASSVGNDIVRVAFDPQETYTATPAADQVELSAIVLGAGEKSLIQGTSADVTHGTEDYRDGDMYRFRSGDIGQVTLRLDWSAVGSELDFALFEENDLSQPIAKEYSVVTEPFKGSTLLVEPNKNYWLWVAAYKDSTNLPQAYKVSLCGRTFQY